MKKALLLWLFIAMSVVHAIAQSRTVSGRVADETGSPLPSATVVIKGTRIGTMTDAQGNYTLTVPENVKASHLTVSIVGYGSTTVNISDAAQVVLKASSEDIAEVVVVGYQTMKRADLTSSASTVGGKEVENKPIPSFTQLLQGKSPGLQITGASGRPGNNAFIRIRGQGSITASSEPIIVLDGNIVPSTVYSSISPDDIADVTVLKDAAATSIYGSRGSNGVLIVTTKKGKGGQPVVSYGFQYGINDALKLKNLTLMDAMQKLQYEYAGEYYSANGILDSMIANRIAAGEYAAGTELPDLTDAQRNQLWTMAASRGAGDWRKYMLPTGHYKRHEISVSGSSDKFNYYLSAIKSDNDGVVYGNYFNQLGGRLNVEYRPHDWLKLGTNMSVINTRTNSIRELFNGQAASASSLLLNPYEPLLGSDGKYNLTSLGQNAMETTDRNPNTQNPTAYFGTFYAQVSPIKHLTLKTQLGLTYYTLFQEYYLQPGSYLADVLGYNQKRDNGARDFRYIFTNTANWQQTFDEKHSINILAGMEFNKDKFYSFSLTARNFPTASVNTLENGATPTQATTSRQDWAVISYFGSAQYDYEKKYYLNVSGRIDGSSRFGKNVRFAQFGAVGLAWDVKNEEFLKDNAIISALKIRGSYGTSGNDQFSPYASLGTSALNVSYNSQPASSPNQLPSPNLTWEKSKQTDLGLDFGFLYDRITGTIDLYNRQTSSLLYSVNVSLTSGFQTVAGNVGGLQNRGIELALSGDIIRKKDLTWTVGATYSYVKNKVTELYSDNTPAANSASLSFLKVGEPIFVYKMVRWAGVNPETGKEEYYTLDGHTTDVFSASNAVILSGKSPLPKYFGSITTNLNYKGFDLSGQLYYSGGNYIMNYVYQTGASAGESIMNQQFTEALDYWKKPGDKVRYPNLNDLTQRSTYDTDKWLEKGNYVTLRDVTLGYNFDQKLLARTRFVKGLRIYAQGTNLLLFTKYHGLPEVGEANGESLAVNPGTYSLYSYPQFRSFTFGLNVKF
ncbi:TonB-dependent receptor [uncultured Chitinophaga sp.]|jgi:TonB-linked outer membrane protein, SusC/RagA family|uniref:SusC/RagA family TonB-linked outer membrane protein n=1 Tax=uncultured Chitinophaga sp. TaxID=339340 RepID=UPI002630AF19|nr:TonB-dependent receptor [uncultured Chitinophaga sp.]